jgi:hypothetical protein
MTPALNQRRSIAIIAFWILFVVSIGLVRRHPWMDTAWNALWLLLVVVAVVFSVREMFRRGRSTGEYIYTRGVPCCLWWIVYDAESYDKLGARDQRKPSDSAHSKINE